MLRHILALTTLVSLARCGCKHVTHNNGRASAICTDEIYGRDFELMLNDDDNYDIAEGQPATKETLAAIYADYEAGTNPNGTLLAKRAPMDIKSDHLKEYFEVCHDRIEGVCADDHVVDWKGTAYGYMDAVEFLMYQSGGGRMRQVPPSICRQFKKTPVYNGYICLQWVYLFNGEIDNTQNSQMAEKSWQCQSKKWSSQTKFVMYPKKFVEVVQYYCISNRATGCRANCDLDQCDLIRPGYDCSPYDGSYYNYDY